VPDLIKEEHQQVAALLKQQVSSELDKSGYDVVPSSFWATAFESAAAAGGGGTASRTKA
jgi:hypothetical protein